MDLVTNEYRFLRRIEREVDCITGRNVSFGHHEISFGSTRLRMLDIGMKLRISSIMGELSDVITQSPHQEHLHAMMTATFLPDSSLADPNNYSGYTEYSVQGSSFSLFKTFIDFEGYDLPKRAVDVQLFNKGYVFAIQSPMADWNPPHNMILAPMLTSPQSSNILTYGIGSQQVLNMRSAGYCNVFLSSKGYSSQDMTGFTSSFPGHKDNLIPLTLLRSTQDYDVEVFPITTGENSIGEAWNNSTGAWELTDPEYIPDQWRNGNILDIPKDYPLGKWLIDFDIFVKS